MTGTSGMVPLAMLEDLARQWEHHASSRHQPGIGIGTGAALDTLASCARELRAVISAEQPAAAIHQAMEDGELPDPFYAPHPVPAGPVVAGLARCARPGRHGPHQYQRTGSSDNFGTWQCPGRD